MLLDSGHSYNSYLPADLGLHYSLQSPSSSPTYSPSYYSSQQSSPFTPASDNTQFVFPSELQSSELQSLQTYKEEPLYKDEWRQSAVSQPASPSAYSGYSGLYLPDSPLLSQSSDALHYNSLLQDNVRYNSTPNIAETVRYSSSSLGHEDQQSRYQEQSFGHTINLANHHQQQSYYQATTNFQVKQSINPSNQQFVICKTFLLLDSAMA